MAMGQGGKPLCDKAQALRDRLAAIDIAATRIATRAHLPTSDDGVAPPADAAVLELGDKLSINGRPVLDPSDVETEVQHRSSRSLVIAIDAHATLKPLPSLLGALGEGIQLYVVASPKGGKRETPPAVLAKDADNPDPNQRAVAFSNLLKKSMGSCKPAEKVFQSLSSAPHDSQLRTLRNDLPVAVDSCACKVDDDFVASIAYLVGGDAPVVAKHLVLSKDAKAMKLSVADLDAQKLYDALPAGASPVHLTP